MMNYLNRFTQLGLLLLVTAFYMFVFSCNACNEDQVQKFSLNREASSNVYKQKCSPCHAIGVQLIGPALVEVADDPETLVKKYKAQKKCHVGKGIASKKELAHIIAYLKISNVFPDSTLNSF